nr:nickel pincer cofactor biosynthesis protein LarC [Actinomycetota bacterium]
HAHRTFGDIQTLIQNADLPKRVAEHALKAFRRLAEAEGLVHGCSPEDVTFHEVGAVDSIVDIVGSCVALESIGAKTVSCGPLPMASGVVSAAHGLIPVPGPATLEVLRDSRVRWTEERRETTTPTGAALMHAFTDGEFTETAPGMTLRSVGYGTGRAELEHAPNLLRVVVGEVEDTAKMVVLIEANVDDASGEILGSVVDRFMESEALDAWLEPIFMKKGRGAYKICALVEESAVEDSASLLMRETGSLGVRYRGMSRVVAERRFVEVDLPYGRCGIKVGSLNGKDFTAAPEHADVAKLARDSSLPLQRIHREALAAFEKMQD